MRMIRCYLAVMRLSVSHVASSTLRKVPRNYCIGPVAALFRFSTEEEAIRLANDTEYGLAG
jgi:acyl-CoA reductase-like NAD-dependent aldehyde dehydrogenase